ncbi:hypothetical protein ACWDY7_16255 [Streptomyces calvus]|uniref:Uncharacterized protein n=1 Tax=Streptomyces calvus TaxID=67282 RepID=A0AA40SKL4_9ACTN|nr:MULTISPECIES: hypothetical protein [Streptomyces]MBA8948023.1 hypothetical protein [Streptomyces calvus]MBA8974406.1 hypothetical protein [Streptomyces calvus]
MSTPKTSRFVRLRVELVLEVEDGDAVTEAALRRITDDGDMPAAERVHAKSAVTEDAAEALAYLVDPFTVVGEVPGVELLQASWSGEQIDYDPDSPEWDLDEDEDEDGEGEDGEGEDDHRVEGAEDGAGRVG